MSQFLLSDNWPFFHFPDKGLLALVLFLPGVHLTNLLQTLYDIINKLNNRRKQSLGMPLRQILKPTISCQHSFKPHFQVSVKGNYRDHHAKSVWGVNHTPYGDSWSRRACCGRKNLGPGAPHWTDSFYRAPMASLCPLCASQATRTVRALSGTQ